MKGSRAILRKIGSLFLLAGLAVGIGYPVYGVFFSGSKLGNYWIKEGVAFGTTTFGSVTTTSGGDLQIGPLSLDPSMNYFRINLFYNTKPTVVGSQPCSFDLALSESGGRQIWILNKTLYIKGDEKKSDKDESMGNQIFHMVVDLIFPKGRSMVGTFEIPKSGQYILEYKNESGFGCKSILNSYLQIRHNSLLVNLMIPGIAAGVVLLGIFLLIISYKKSKSETAN